MTWMSKLDRIYKTNLLIYKGDREAAKKATRAFMKHLMVLEGLWLPNRKKKEA